MTFIGGPRREHEAIAANAIRWRRIENGEPTAAYVLDQWRRKQRLAKVRLVAVTSPARSGASSSAT